MRGTKRFQQANRGSKGLVLPVVVAMLAGLWLLVIFLLSQVMVSQRSTDMRDEVLQAELAAYAGVQHALAILQQGCANDDYLVIQETAASPRQPPRLYLVRPQVKEGDLRYDYRALFTEDENFDPSSVLKAPDWMVDDEELPARLLVHPWLEPVEVDWLPVHNDKGEMVARHAFWVEDLEGRIDPSMVGLESEGPIRLQAMDRSADHERTRQLLKHRKLMLSPESTLAAAGLSPPLERWPHRTADELAGRLKDPWAAFLEANAVVGLQVYEEQARVPFVPGVSPSVMGLLKRNLNRLLNEPPSDAVHEMAQWMGIALPEFENRQGGFPENYLETLAANALDYADQDSIPTLQAGRYRGIDGQAFLSEVVLHLHYQGLVREDDRWVLKWSLRLFGELWNLTDKPIENGEARLSYEVNLRPTAIGLRGPGKPFDSPELLEDPEQSQHSLERDGKRYLTPYININLRPDEYRFYEFAKVDYSIECVPQLDEEGEALPEWFDLVEQEHEARGLSLIWNGQEVERLHRIHRDPHGLANFRTDQRRKTAKACIPGLNYGTYSGILNNPGDPRISHYMRGMPLGENAYPENLSPHRRNLRRRNIYDRDPSPYKTRHYGRVMPSQWPDGGHDSATGDYRVTTSDARFPTDAEWWPHTAVPAPQASHAPQHLSNIGRFMQVTELGRIHDPVMWAPAYPDLPGLPGSGQHDTNELNGLLSIWQRPAMPLRREAWPEVSRSSQPSQIQGGGNSLRIGRPEHARFDRPGWRASHLLDLFHCGQPDSDDPELWRGHCIRAEGRVNLNTANREALRCLVYGALREDEAIARIISRVHDTQHAFGPQLEAWQATDEELERVARRIADGIVSERPFASLSEIAHIRDEEDQSLFGNPALHSADDVLQWSDAAAEESFARLHQAGGLRSRNFRVWVVGQSVRVDGEKIEVTAVTRRVVTVFADPGERGANGEIVKKNHNVRILHERDF